jgi:hypothetical protein
MSGLFDRLQGEIDQRDRQSGLSTAELLELPDELRRLVQLLLRSGPQTSGEVAAALGLDAAAAEALVEALVDKGLARPVAGVSETRYRVSLARRRSRQLPGGIWRALADRSEAGDAD